MLHTVVAVAIDGRVVDGEVIHNTATIEVEDSLATTKIFSDTVVNREVFNQVLLLVGIEQLVLDT